MNHAAGEVRRFAKGRIANDVEIGVAGETEAGAESQATGFFDIGKKLKRVADAHAGVDGDYAGGCGLENGPQTVDAAIGGWKRRMELENEISLGGEPELRGSEVREEGFDIGRNGD